MRSIFKGKYSSIIILSISVFIAFQACKKDPSIPNINGEDQNWTIDFKVPSGWPSPVYYFSGNELTKAGFILGRKLFYDTRLSKDNTISCGTCHQSFAAFANADHDVSHGINGLLGTRNSPPLFNLNWHPDLMWDGGVNHIEMQPVAPITNPVEMDETIENVVNKINLDPEYLKLSKEAFGVSNMNSERMLKALAQFMGAMVSANSKYDQYKRNEGGVSLNAAELAGLKVFESKCASCHPAPLFTDLSIRNVGLKPSVINDSGRAKITLDPMDLYKFKVPSLRNLTYTAPYFHDGRAATLDDVFDQMEHGVWQSPSLDPLMKEGIALSTQEREDIKAFLKTLDDPTFINDKRFFEPVKP